MSVSCWLLFDDCCLLRVDLRFMVEVCCLLFVMCCVLGVYCLLYDV